MSRIREVFVTSRPPARPKRDRGAFEAISHLLASKSSPKLEELSSALKFPEKIESTLHTVARYVCRVAPHSLFTHGGGP